MTILERMREREGKNTVDDDNKKGKETWAGDISDSMYFLVREQSKRAARRVEGDMIILMWWRTVPGGDVRAPMSNYPAVGLTIRTRTKPHPSILVFFKTSHCEA